MEEPNTLSAMQPGEVCSQPLTLGHCYELATLREHGETSLGSAALLVHKLTQAAEFSLLLSV